MEKREESGFEEGNRGWENIKLGKCTHLAT